MQQEIKPFNKILLNNFFIRED